MTKPLVRLNIYVPSQEEKEEIVAKAMERDKSVSELIVAYFRRLPRRK